MDQKIIEQLRQCGLEEKTATVYVALLEIGEATIQAIARKTKLNRTSLYTIVETLKERGLVFQTKVRKHTHYVAEDPEELLRQIETTKEELTKLVVPLQTLWQRSSKRPRVLLFDGSEGFRKIWHVIFSSGIKEYLIITDPQEMLGFVQKGYITGKIIDTKKKLGIKSRQLIAFSEYAKGVVAKDAVENRKSKILSHIYRIPFTTIIFGDRVALISPFREDIMMIIESDAFAKTQTSLFEALWDALPN